MLGITRISAKEVQGAIVTALRRAWVGAMALLSLSR